MLTGVKGMLFNLLRFWFDGFYACKTDFSALSVYKGERSVIYAAVAFHLGGDFILNVYKFGLVKKYCSM